MNQGLHDILNPAVRSTSSGAGDGCRVPAATRGFTFVELLVVVAVIALLSCVAVPCLTRVNPGSKAAQCQTNTRRLVAAWQMYAYDNSDRMAVMLHGAYAQGGNFPPALGPAWCEGWLDWSLSPDNTNSALLLNPRYAKLAGYLGQQPEVFQCPADRYLSSNQRAFSWSRRVRSYSGSVGLGQGNAEAGPWDTLYRHITNTVDFLYPGPAETWVFIEEHPDSMNDPAFFSPQQGIFTDAAATYHNGACSFSFADGHAEMHQWVGGLTSPKAAMVTAQDGTYLNVSIATTNGDPDLHWLSFHSQRRSATSY